MTGLSGAGSSVILWLLHLPPSLQGKEPFNFTGFQQGMALKCIKDYSVISSNSIQEAAEPKPGILYSFGLIFDITFAAQLCFAC